jgi:acyl carrier protein
MSNKAVVTEAEIAELIVSALRLRISPSDIQPDEPLFGDGLSLDSMDALEIAFAISRRYGFEVRADEARAEKIFASLRALTSYIRRMLRA